MTLDIHAYRHAEHREELATLYAENASLRAANTALTAKMIHAEQEAPEFIFAGVLTTGTFVVALIVCSIASVGCALEHSWSGLYWLAGALVSLVISRRSLRGRW